MNNFFLYVHPLTHGEADFAENSFSIFFARKWPKYRSLAEGPPFQKFPLSPGSKGALTPPTHLPLKQFSHCPGGFDGAGHCVVMLAKPGPSFELRIPLVAPPPPPGPLPVPLPVPAPMRTVPFFAISRSACVG